ncbi:hypothetical protein ACRAWD_11380 [Caulobacter segnis]
MAYRQDEASLGGDNPSRRRPGRPDRHPARSARRGRCLSPRQHRERHPRARSVRKRRRPSSRPAAFSWPVDWPGPADTLLSATRPIETVALLL